MKILKFEPILPSKIPESKRPSTSDGPDFESVIKSVAKRPASSPASTGAVGRENYRALTLPSASELGMAGQLLSRLGADIRAASPEMLKNVHNLEGLIYVYNKNSG